MIRGIHGLIYSSDPEATRAFFRDALRLPHTDVGGGWLIFDFPEGDLGFHPLDEGGKPPPNTHNVSFYCDDIDATVADLESRGAIFKHPPQDHGYGFVTYFAAPGGVEVQLYQPRYQKRQPAKPAAKAAAKPSTKKAVAKKPATKAKAKPKKR